MATEATQACPSPRRFHASNTSKMCGERCATTKPQHGCTVMGNSSRSAGARARERQCASRKLCRPQSARRLAGCTIPRPSFSWSMIFCAVRSVDHGFRPPSTLRRAAWWASTSAWIAQAQRPLPCCSHELCCPRWLEKLGVNRTKHGTPARA